MAYLTEAARHALPTDAFAVPSKRAYPIHDLDHAKDALIMVDEHGTPSEQKQVKAAVYKRYPQLRSRRSSSSRRPTIG